MWIVIIISSTLFFWTIKEKRSSVILLLCSWWIASKVTILRDACQKKASPWQFKWIRFASTLIDSHPSKNGNKFFLTLLLENCFRYPLAVGIKLTSYPFRIFTALKNKQVLPTICLFFSFFYIYLIMSSTSSTHTHTRKPPWSTIRVHPPSSVEMFFPLKLAGKSKLYSFLLLFFVREIFFFFITCW